MREESPTISIVVPALNEAANLRVVLPALPEVHEVVLVDGNSVDGTIETARKVRPGIKIMRQTRRGKGNALVCGFAAATGDIVVMFDADGSADPAEIPMFVKALTDGADYAKGSRFCRTGMGQHGSEDISQLRLLGNAGLNSLANILFGTRFSDLCYGYNAFWRRILPALHLPPVSAPEVNAGHRLWGDGFEIEAVLSCRVAAAQLRVAEVPSLEHERIFGDTNLRTFVDGSRVLRTIIFERLAAGSSDGGTGTMAPALEMPLRSEIAVGLRALTALNALQLPRLPVVPLATRSRHAGRIQVRSATSGGPRSYLSGIRRTCTGRKDADDDS